MRDVDGYRMVTVRTFMPTTMMTPKKKRELQEYGEFSDNAIELLEREHLNSISKEIHIPMLK